MIGHLDALILALINLVRKLLGVDQSSRQMIPVRVRSRHAQILRQSSQSNGNSSRELNALPAWPGGSRFWASSPSSMSLGNNDPSGLSLQPEDL